MIQKLCKICDQPVTEHSDEQIARCIIEDERLRVLRCLQNEVNRQRKQHERRLAKI